MAYGDEAPKPANQGSNNPAPTQMPKTSGTPSLDRSAPVGSQDYRGYAPDGVGPASGNGTGNSVPQDGAISG